MNSHRIPNQDLSVSRYLSALYSLICICTPHSIKQHLHHPISLIKLATHTSTIFLSLLLSAHDTIFSLGDNDVYYFNFTPAPSLHAVTPSPSPIPADPVDVEVTTGAASSHLMLNLVTLGLLTRTSLLTCVKSTFSGGFSLNSSVS